MEATGFDLPWTLGIVLPICVSASAFVVNKLYRTTLAKVRLAYDVREERSALTKTDNRLVSVVRIWNDGEDVIERSMFSGREPLRIEVTPGRRLLNASVVKVAQPATGVAVNLIPGQRYASIDFEYLSTTDGFEFEIITDAPKGEVKVLGILKASGRHPTKKNAQDNGIRYVGAVILFLGCAIDTTNTLASILENVGWNSVAFWTYLPAPVILVAGSFFIMSALLSWFTSPARSLEKKLARIGS